MIDGSKERDSPDGWRPARPDAQPSTRGGTWRHETRDDYVSTVTAVLDDIPWTPSEIREQFQASSPLIQRLQLLLAREPEREIGADEAAEALGTTRQALAGAVGAYSNLVYRHWSRNQWPFSVRRDYRGGRTFYSMSPEVAGIVASVPASGRE